jgi:hypothetical protein
LPEISGKILATLSVLKSMMALNFAEFVTVDIDTVSMTVSLSILCGIS